jgi:hypothetical protein
LDNSELWGQVGGQPTPVSARVAADDRLSFPGKVVKHRRARIRLAGGAGRVGLPGPCWSFGYVGHVGHVESPLCSPTQNYLALVITSTVPRSCGCNCCMTRALS